MSKIACVSTFFIGSALGSTAMWLVLKNKYEQLVQEEIDSVKEEFEKLTKKEVDDDHEKRSGRYPWGPDESYEHHNTDKNYEKPNVVEYASKVNGLQYSDIKQDMAEPVEKPYTISPDEFGELDDYIQVSLTYYADKVLADETDELLDDIDNSVGYDSLACFGEYEEDCVFVRNDHQKIDYEIVADERTYIEVLKEKPYLADSL